MRSPAAHPLDSRAARLLARQALHQVLFRRADQVGHRLVSRLDSRQRYPAVSPQADPALSPSRIRPQCQEGSPPAVRALFQAPSQAQRLVYSRPVSPAVALAHSPVVLLLHNRAHTRRYSPPLSLLNCRRSSPPCSPRTTPPVRTRLCRRRRRARSRLAPLLRPRP